MRGFLLAFFLFIASGCNLYGGGSCPDGGAFTNLDDTDLWACIQDTGGDAIIGLKNPEEDEGVDSEGNVLVSDEDLAVYRSQVEAVEGIEVRSGFRSIPALVVEIESGAALSNVRALDIVEYVEPN